MTVEYLNKSNKMTECLFKVAVNLKKFRFQSGKSSHFKAAHLDLVKVQPLDNQDKKTDVSVEKEKEVKERAVNEEENKKKSEKPEFDSNMAFLNSLAFFTLFLIIFCCDMAFWITIGV